MGRQVGREAVMVMDHFVQEWTWLFGKMRADAEQVAEQFRRLADALNEPGGED